MRLLLAARLSQAKIGQTGLDSQDADARAWAERNGHEVIATAADKISGRVAPSERPNLGPWLTRPELMARYDGIVVSKLDRLSRGRDWAVREWAEEHGKKLLVVSPELSWPPEPGDTATPIIWDTLINISSAEWSNTSARYRRMQQHLRSIGSQVGRYPFGYRTVLRDGVKALEPAQEDAEAVRTVAAMYLEGRSLRWLCGWLDEAGIVPPGGGAWAPKSLGQLFRNPILAGRQVDSAGKRTSVKVDPILGREIWAALQKEMDRKATRKGVTPGNTAMLTNIAMCGYCGGPMFRIHCGRKRKDGTKAHYWYYRCHGADARHPSTCANMFPLEQLEARLDRYMTHTMSRWPRYETVTISGYGHDDEIADVESDLRELDFDAPNFGERQKALLAERARLKALPSIPDSSDRRPAGDTVGQHWATLKTSTDKRRFLLQLGMTVRAERGRKMPDGEREPDTVTFEVFGPEADMPQFVNVTLDDDDPSVPQPEVTAAYPAPEFPDPGSA